MKTFVLASMLAVTCSHAHALSCLRPDPVTTFQQLAAELAEARRIGEKTGTELAESRKGATKLETELTAAR